LIGQFKHITDTNSPTEIYNKWSEQWPDASVIRFLTLGNKEILLVNTLAAHKEVLQTKCYEFTKPDILYKLIADIVGNGVIFQNGETHRRYRRVLGGMFLDLPLFSRDWC